MASEAPNAKVRPDDRRGVRPGEGAFMSNGAMIGQAPHIPTPEMRKTVLDMARVAFPSTVAKALKLSPSTLYRHYREELDFGAAESVVAVGAKLLQKAMGGDTQAISLYLRYRGGWQAAKDHAAYGEDNDDAAGGNFDFSAFLEGKSAEELERYVPIIEQLLIASGHQSSGAASAAGTGESEDFDGEAPGAFGEDEGEPQ